MMETDSLHQADEDVEDGGTKPKDEEKKETDKDENDDESSSNLGSSDDETNTGNIDDPLPELQLFSRQDSESMEEKPNVEMDSCENVDETVPSSKKNIAEYDCVDTCSTSAGKLSSHMDVPVKNEHSKLSGVSASMLESNGVEKHGPSPISDNLVRNKKSVIKTVMSSSKSHSSRKREWNRLEKYSHIKEKTNHSTNLLSSRESHHGMVDKCASGDSVKTAHSRQSSVRKRVLDTLYNMQAPEEPLDLSKKSKKRSRSDLEVRNSERRRTSSVSGQSSSSGQPELSSSLQSLQQKFGGNFLFHSSHRRPRHGLTEQYYMSNMASSAMSSWRHGNKVHRSQVKVHRLRDSEQVNGVDTRAKEKADIKGGLTKDVDGSAKNSQTVGAILAKISISSDEDKPVKTESHDNKYTTHRCSCQKSFITLFELSIHLQESGHSPGQSKQTNLMEYPKLVRGQDMWLNQGSEQTKQILRCIQCGESYKTLPELTVHMMKTQHYTKIVSTEHGRRAHKCSAYCEKESAENDCVFKCKICQEAFQDMEGLANHMVVSGHHRKQSHCLNNSTDDPHVHQKRKHHVRKELTRSSSSPDQAMVATLLDYKRTCLESKLCEETEDKKRVRSVITSRSSVSKSDNPQNDSQITCENCGERIEMDMFVEHIRLCLRKRVEAIHNLRLLHGATSMRCDLSEGHDKQSVLSKGESKYRPSRSPVRDSGFHRKVIKSERRCHSPPSVYKHVKSSKSGHMSSSGHKLNLLSKSIPLKYKSRSVPLHSSACSVALEACLPLRAKKPQTFFGDTVKPVLSRSSQHSSQSPEIPFRPETLSPKLNKSRHNLAIKMTELLGSTRSPQSPPTAAELSPLNLQVLRESVPEKNQHHLSSPDSNCSLPPSPCITYNSRQMSPVMNGVHVQIPSSASLVKCEPSPSRSSVSSAGGKSPCPEDRIPRTFTPKPSTELSDTRPHTILKSGLSKQDCRNLEPETLSDDSTANLDNGLDQKVNESSRSAIQQMILEYSNKTVSDSSHVSHLTKLREMKPPVQENRFNSRGFKTYVSTKDSPSEDDKKEKNEQSNGSSKKGGPTLDIIDPNSGDNSTSPSNALKAMENLIEKSFESKMEKHCKKMSSSELLRQPFFNQYGWFYQGEMYSFQKMYPSSQQLTRQSVIEEKTTNDKVGPAVDRNSKVKLQLNGLDIRDEAKTTEEAIASVFRKDSDRSPVESSPPPNKESIVNKYLNFFDDSPGEENGKSKTSALDSLSCFVYGQPVTSEHPLDSLQRLITKADGAPRALNGGVSGGQRSPVITPDQSVSTGRKPCYTNTDDDNVPLNLTVKCHTVKTEQDRPASSHDHEEHIHDGDSSAANSDNEIADYKCPACSRQFASKGSYRYHLSRCHLSTVKKYGIKEAFHMSPYVYMPLDHTAKFTKYYEMAQELANKELETEEQEQ